MPNQKKHHTTIWAISTFGIAAVAAAAVITIFSPSMETTAVIASLFAFVIALTTVLLNAVRMSEEKTSREIKKVQEDINGKMEEQLRLTRAVGRAEGVEAEREDERGRRGREEER